MADVTGMCLLQYASYCVGPIMCDSKTVVGTIRSPSQLSDVVVVVGSVSIAGSTAALLVDNALQHIASNCQLSSNAVLSIASFPHLQSIGAGLSIDGAVAGAHNNTVLAVVMCPSLTWVAGAMTIVHSDDVFNTALTLVHMPLLAWIGGALVLERALSLTQLSLPQLVQVGGYVTIDRNPSLSVLRLSLQLRVDGTCIACATMHTVQLCFNGAALMPPMLVRTPGTCFHQYGGACVGPLRCDWAAVVVDALYSLHALRSFTHVDDNIVVTQSLITVLNAPALLYVGVSLAHTRSTTTSVIACPQLTLVAGSLDVDGNIGDTDNAVLEAVLLPALQCVGDILIITNSNSDLRRNVALTLMDLSRLSFVGGALQLRGAAVLPALSTEQLTYIGAYLCVSMNAALTVLDMPALVRVANIGQLYSEAINAGNNSANLTIAPNILLAAQGMLCIYPPLYCFLFPGQC